MTSLDPDQARVLRVLRYWFGPEAVEVLAVLEHRGSGGSGGASPPLASRQLALSIPEPSAQHRPPVKAGEAARWAWP